LLLNISDIAKLDAELSEDDRSKSSYVRQRNPRYGPIGPLAGDFNVSGQRQRRGRPIRAESPDSGWLLDDLHPYETLAKQLIGGDSGGGCFPPIRRPYPNSPRKEKEWKFVWPRDQNPRHGRWGYWDRIKDLATGKGPDIWIGELHSSGPHHSVWTGWKTAGYQHPADMRVRWTSLGGESRQDLERLSPIKAARRDDGKKYDHRTRRYRTPRPGMWSDVVWSDTKGGGPLYTRDETGREWVAPQVDGGYFNNGLGRNPFFRNLP